MKTIIRVSFVLTAVIVLIVSSLARESDESESGFSVLTGPYLGQAPPGPKSVLFADGVVANRYQSFHTSLMFSAEGKECYWQAKLSGNEWAIVVSKLVDGRWTEPEIASISKIEYRDDAPFITPDGEKLFFISRRPINEGMESGKENIWVVEKTNDGWGEPEPLPQTINSMSGIHWQVSVDRKRDLYFGTHQNESRGRRGNIYCSRLVDGQYTEPAELGPEINSPDYEFSPFIAPDGSYLIFSREEYGVGTCRLFISYRTDNGSWSEPADLYETHGIKGICPIVSKDNRYLFFLDYVNSRALPLWVSAGFIEELRP